MPAIKIISLESFGGRRWAKPHDYRFAATDMFVPLVVKELPFALRQMPLCFVGIEGELQLVGLVGLNQGENLFVSPEGSWLGGYLPLMYQHYPFLLGKLQDGNDALAICDDPACLSDTGERFFDDAGKPTPVIQDTFNRLVEHAQHAKMTHQATAELVEHNVLELWPLTVQSGEKSRGIDALYRVNEARLRDLSGPTLALLRDSGSLVIAYAQLFSMAQVHILGALAGRRSESVARAEPMQSTNVENHGNISFDGF